LCPSEEATREWGELAKKWATIEIGAENMVTRQVAEIARNPKGFEGWGSQPRMVVERPIDL
jgi:hypothetical protein